MVRFEENNCRICKKVFCCQDCRLEHEKIKHKINPDCDICVFGKTSAKVFCLDLLNHIIAFHCPLNCIFCKKMFNSIEELTQHDKCAAITSNSFKSPRTPVNTDPKTISPSNLLTPYYKNKLPGNHHVGLSITMAVTSTPLLPRDESENKLGATPSIDCSKIKYVYKSSLKLTGSSTLNESKRSERRVTFSETPMIEPCRKTKHQIVQKIDCESSDNSDDSFVSVKDEEDLQNKENYKPPPLPQDTNLTEWNTALTSSDSKSHLDQLECVDLSKFHEEVESSHPPVGLWSSMTSMVKSVMQNISITAQIASLPPARAKRALPDYEVDVPRLKRMKFSDIKCRRPIRELSPLTQIRLVVPKYVDKSTQTD